MTFLLLTKSSIQKLGQLTMSKAHLASPSSNYLVRDLISHTRRVCSLYKRMLQDTEFTEDGFFESRFKKLKIRREFDKYKNIKDMRAAKALLETAEADFKVNQHVAMKLEVVVHPHSKEGIAYERSLLSPDWVMDYHHPLVKAQYPYYFAKREAMKEDYMRLWKKKMTKPGTSEVDTHAHH